MAIRSSDLAGYWYPGTEKECRETIDGLIKDISHPKQEYSGYGGIVPHAGWFFSGRTALSVFYSIRRARKPALFFLFGMHLPENSSHRIFVDDGIETPLGVIRVNRKATEMLCEAFDFIQENARRYTRDNTTELQLPFIKRLFPEAEIVVIGVSPGEEALKMGERAASISKELGLEPCFIGSTDLTHYGPNYGFMPQGRGPRSVDWVREVNDKRIIDLFLRVKPKEGIEEALASRNACCPAAAAASIAAVRSMGVEKGVLIHYTTSFDIQSDSSFVGYAGIVF